MDTTYRFRFLIYVAAFMLVMSLCFVYAEPLPSRSHLLFQHAGSATAAQEPVFDPSALRMATPMVSPQALRHLEDASHSRHGFFHRAKHPALPLPAADLRSESSAAGLTVASPAAAPTAR